MDPADTHTSKHRSLWMPRAGLFLLVAVAAWLIPACEVAEQPPYSFVIKLTGSPYDRGLKHGKAFGDRIRSLYAGLLTNSILPYLNRERPDIADVLNRYKGDEYVKQFSTLLMLESAQHMEPYIPEPYVQEMHGIADGAGIPYEQILILNTFLDTMLGFRAMTFFIRKLQAPEVVRVTFDGGLDTDGVDNDGDGDVDEADEGLFEPYDPSPHAIMAEVPTTAQVKIVLKDTALMAIPEGVDPDSIRIQLDKTIYGAGDPSIQTRKFVENSTAMLEVTFAPPGGFPNAAVVSLLLQAADKAWITDPPPGHARIMRDERFVFTTTGYGKEPWDVENRGEEDGRTQPPSVSFAVRGSATPNGQPLLAHDYALLDSNTSHKHTVLFLIEPDEGIPHAVLGWTGVVGGFSGMNTEGLVFAVNDSDSLDNPMAGEVKNNSFEAQLVMSGVPIMVMGRELLTHSHTVPEAVEYLRTTKRTLGWNVLLEDATGDMAAVEVDGDSFGDADHGFYEYTPDASVPDNLDPHGNRWNSIGPDDLRMGSHYVRNAEDVRATVIAYEVLPQRYWTSFYYRSLRATALLGEAMQERYGQIDEHAAMDILALPNLTDDRDSMNAAVFLPAQRKLYYAMGAVPATDAGFKEIDLTTALQSGGQP